MSADSISHGAVKSEEEHRRDLCIAGRWIHERGFVASTDGNMSVRLGADRILTTPTCMSKGMMTPDDMVITDLTGRRVSGSRKPSSEIGMHLLIYRLRPEVNAVCHAHPPTATGYAAAGMALDKPILCELIIGLGSIPVARYGTPGTPELAAAMEPLVQGHDAILMANHGVVTYGPDLMRAYYKMETVEHFAKVSLVTELLGRQVLLSDAEVDKLLTARASYFGPGTPAVSRSTACPVTEGTSAPVAVTLPDSGAHFWVSRAELEAMVAEAIEGKGK